MNSDLPATTIVDWTPGPALVWGLKLSRALLVVAFAAGCISLFASFRTANYGSSPLFVILFSVPVYVVLQPFLWLLFRRISLNRLLVLGYSFSLLCVGIPEVYGSFEEWTVRRAFGDVPDHSFTVQRWYPFRHHTISYDTQLGWSACD